MNRTCALILGGLSLVVSIYAFPQTQSKSASGLGAEDIFIVRSVRESRGAPTEFCAEAKIGFATVNGAEDKFTLRSTVTQGSNGLMTNSSVQAVGSFRGCFGPLPADPKIAKFYAEGALGTVTFKGRGECIQIRDVPEKGMSTARCFLELYDLSSGYVGGFATSNAINSFMDLGESSIPVGYAQTGIFTVRLWKRR